MELDITGIARSSSAPVQEIVNRPKPIDTKALRQAKDVAKKLSEAAAETKQDRIQVERYLSDIVKYTRFFNKRLRFSINEELNQVVVKVIDSQTDKVIKEIPPAVLQRLHVRIREAIGLLVDEII
ncbi:MAG: flagellar protein FlaG [Spirochaetales bacterium]|jgi:flagellar protein FlaG|nr:flagellar protein FlaG [Spirochaetales bacterium]